MYPVKEESIDVKITNKNQNAQTEFKRPLTQLRWIRDMKR